MINVTAEQPAARPNLTTDRLLGLSAVAKQLDVSIWTIRRWVQTGRLSSMKLGARRLIRESEIIRAIAEGLRKAEIG
jgi:excisionase family DNA binding protein